MSRTLKIRPLAAETFAPFGDVLEISGEPDRLINQGMCGRYHDRARLDFGDGRAGISLFLAQSRTLPLTLDMMERHPHGSQAFIPMHRNTFLIVVANDAGGTPDVPLAFQTASGQGVNFHRGVWHGVLCPLADPGAFAVIDRIGSGSNLEEHWFDDPWTIAGEENEKAGATLA